MRNIAKIISVIFHPFLLPSYGYIMLLCSDAFFAQLSTYGVCVILSLVFVFTLLLPLGFIYLSQFIFHRKLDLHRRQDRVYPFFFTIVSYFSGAYIMGYLAIDAIYSRVLFMCALVLCTIQLINSYWKISAHMAGIGGFMGIFFGVCWVMSYNIFMLATLLILLAGAIGSSRLLLERHTPAQVYAGFVLGISYPLSYFWFLMA